MNAEDIHKISQAAAEIRDQFIPMLYAFYKKCVAEGFSEEQAFNLTKTYMIQILNKSYYPPEKID